MRNGRFVICILFAASLPAMGQASNLVLKVAWAQKYRNRLSIETRLIVTHVSPKEQDADIHGGSRKNQVGLPMVAEILNGTEPSQSSARAQLQPGSSDKAIYGAWRLWFEHPPHGGGTQCQLFDGQAPPICARQSLGGPESNPDHSFEIHPVFAVNGVSVARTSMVLKDNAQVKTPEKAFDDYMGKTRKLTIARTKTGLTLSSSQIGDNYVRMRIRVLTKSTATTRDNGSVDGGWLRADVVTDDDDKVLAKNVRVFYYLDSAPGDKLHAGTPGDEIEILAMPRLDLDRILAVSQDKNVTVTPLPIEFIAVALIAGT